MFEEKVFETIKKYNMIEENDSIVVAVSGGPDSMSLLSVLIKLKQKMNITLVVAHVNHMIRAVADSETEYVKKFCHDNGIDCFVKKVDGVKLAEQQKISTEEILDMIFLKKFLKKLMLIKLQLHIIKMIMQKLYL